MDQAKILKREIFEKVKQFYEAVHKDRQFIPGKSRIHYAGRVFDEQEMCNMVDAVLDFWITLGPYGDQLEQGFANFLDVREAILVNPGSSANLIALAALMSPQLDDHLLPGDEVITPAVTFLTTFTPIMQNGLIPVVVDCELGTYNINPDRIEEAISPGTRAMLIPHTLGNPCQMDKIMEICSKYTLYLIEDTCDALGAKYDGKLAGTFGDFSTLSCYPAYHISMGEGGIIFTSSAKLVKIARSVRDWGRDCWYKGDVSPNGACGKRFQYKIKMGGEEIDYDHRYVYSNIGYNLKPTDIQAAMGLAQLKKLDYFIERRRHNFNGLFEGLKRYEEVFILPRWNEKAEPSWFAFPLTIRPGSKFSRRELLVFLEKANIETRLLFAGNILRQPAFKGLDCRVVGNLANSDLVMTNTFFIGVYPGIGDEEFDYVLQKFEEFLDQANK
jgi:CDP-6-deoxy-D-xylo-4-hexulose-3-dehydrase